MLSCRAVAATHAVEAAEAVERQQPRGRASAESVRGEWCEPRPEWCERVGSERVGCVGRSKHELCNALGAA